VDECKPLVPGVFHTIFRPFQFLLGYIDPAKPDVDPMHEWFFRSGQGLPYINRKP